MSSFFDVLASRWATPSRVPVIGFIQSSAYVYLQSAPTGDPVDLLHDQYGSAPFSGFIIGDDNPVPINTPRFVLVSFLWGNGIGAVDANPKWTWRNDGGVASTITAQIFGDGSATPTTLLATQVGDNTFDTFGYDGATAANNYYKLVLTASNVIGPSDAFSNTQQNLLPVPTVTLTSSAFAGTVGSTSAVPTWTWTYGGGVGTKVWSFIVDGVTIETGTSSITSYAFIGATVFNKVYTFSVVVTNGSGSANFSSSLPNAQSVGVGIASQNIGYGTAANPTVTTTSSNAATVTIQLLQSKTTTDPGPTVGGYTQINSVVYSGAPISANITYTYTGATIVGRFYRWRVVGVNSASTVTTISDTSLPCTNP
jgi:hypothetical protein